MPAGLQWQGENGHVAVDRALGEDQEAGDGERHDENVDRDEIGRKQPGRSPDIALVVVLDHGDMELARQQQDSDRRQAGHDDHGGPVDGRGEDFRDARIGGAAAPQILQPAEYAPCDGDADREEGDELHQ